MTQRDAALKKRQALINKGVVERKGIKICNECIFINKKFHYRVSKNIIVQIYNSVTLPPMILKVWSLPHQADYLNPLKHFF